LYKQILQLASGITTVHPNANLSLIQPFVIHVTSAVRATAWLTVLDGTQPIVFDIDIDTSLSIETD